MVLLHTDILLDVAVIVLRIPLSGEGHFIAFGGCLWFFLVAGFSLIESDRILFYSQGRRSVRAIWLVSLFLEPWQPFLR